MSEYRLEVEISQERALDSLRKLIAQLEATERSGQRVDRTLHGLGRTSNNISSGLSILARNTSNAGEGMIRLNRSSNDLNDSMLLLTKSFVSYELAARSIAAADEYNNIQNRLKLVTDSQQELNIATNDTFNIAQKTGAVWSSVVQVYQRFLDISDQLGKSQQEIGSITETVSKAVAMSGATAESANAAIIQFSQGLASGVLRGQEYNSVAEQTPALLDAIARGLGKTRSELRAMALDGKLTTDVIIGALENSKDSTDELFSRMNLGVSATFNKLRNATVAWVGELNEALGATTALNAVLNTLAENLDGAAFLIGAAAIAYMTKALIENTTAAIAKAAADRQRNALSLATIQATAASTAATAAETRAAVAAAAASVADARAKVANATSATALARAKAVLTQREAALAAATAADTAATAANTAATNALAAASSRLNMIRGAALGLVGGPAGLIALGIGAVSMLALLNRETDVNAETAKKHAKYLEMTNDQLDRMADIEKRVAVDEMTESFKAQNKELEIMESRFQTVVNDLAFNMGKMGQIESLTKVREVHRLLLADQISFEEALERINKIPFVTAEQRAQLLEAEKQYNATWSITDKLQETLRKFGVEVKMAGDESQNAALKNNQLNASLGETTEEATKASKALEDFRKKQLNQIAQNAYYVRRAKDTSKEQAEAEAKLYAETGKPISKEDRDLIAFNLKLQAQANAIEQSEKDAEKRRKDSSSQAEKDAEKRAKDASREFERRQKDYQQYLDATTGSVEALQQEFQDFLRLYDEFGAQDPAALEKVRKHYGQLIAEAQMDLHNYATQWEDYFNTDLDNINKKYKQEEYLLRHNADLNDAEKKRATDDLKKAWANEIDLIMIKEDMARLEARKTFMTEKQYLEELNALRKAEINYTPGLSDDQKNTRVQGQENDYQNQVNSLDQAMLQEYISTLQSAGLGGGAQSQLETQLNTIKDTVRNAYDEGVIDKETYLNVLRDLDTKYWNDTHQMWTTMWSSSLDGWSNFFQNVAGENSSAYKAIFALQKSFAVASAALNIQKAISDGWATGATIYDKMAAVATIISQTGSIVSDISSIALGFKDGGYTGSIGKNNVAGFVHGNEFVMPAEETARYRSDLERMRNGTFDSNKSVGGMSVQVSNVFNITGDQVNSEGSKGDMLQLGSALEQAIMKVLRDACGQGGIINRFVKGNL